MKLITAPSDASTLKVMEHDHPNVPVYKDWAVGFGVTAKEHALSEKEEGRLLEGLSDFRDGRTKTVSPDQDILSALEDDSTGAP